MSNTAVAKEITPDLRHIVFAAPSSSVRHVFLLVGGGQRAPRQAAQTCVRVCVLSLGLFHAYHDPNE